MKPSSFVKGFVKRFDEPGKTVGPEIYPTNGQPAVQGDIKRAYADMGAYQVAAFQYAKAAGIRRARVIGSHDVEGFE
jgi:hypothetical protein